MYVLGIVISLSGILLTMYIKHIPFAVFYNPSSIIMLTASIMAVLTASKGFSIFYEGLKAAASPKAIISAENRERAISLFRLLSKVTALASLALTAIGTMSALMYLDDVDNFTHALVAALTGIVLGLFLIFAVFEPAAFILKKPHSSEN